MYDHRRRVRCIAAVLLVLGMGLMGTPRPAGSHPVPPGGVPRPVTTTQTRFVTQRAPGTATAAAPQLSPTPDPDLRPGWPVQMYGQPGTYQAGPALAVLVGAVGADPRPQILVSGLAAGPLYAWYGDGQPGSAAALQGGSGAVYTALGFFGGRGLERAATVFDLYHPYFGVYQSDGRPQTGWPRLPSNYITGPPVLADVDGDGQAEIFLDEEDRRLHAYRADGTPLPGWPQFTAGSQQVNMPAIADLDGDGHPEVIVADGWTSNGTDLYAWHSDGGLVPGFPVHFPDGFAQVPVAIGDVTGDGVPEIIMPSPAIVGGNPVAAVQVVSATGQVLHTMLLTPNGSNRPTPVLADLTGDGIPEIIVGTEATLYAFSGNGVPLPGWPQSWTIGTNGNTSPAVGDLDGDGWPDLVTVANIGYSGVEGAVRAFNHLGQLLPGFPKFLPVSTGMDPAIADLDGDGRNELIVGGTAWDGQGGWQDAVWVYDLHGAGAYGRIEWGQLGGGPDHAGRYVPATVVGTVTPSTGTVTSTPLPAATRTVTATATPSRSATRTVIATATPTTTLPPLVTHTATGTPGLPATTRTPTAIGTAGGTTATATGTRTATETSTPISTATVPPTQTSAPPTPLTTVTSTPCRIVFSDVQPTDYFATPVQYLACHGILSGYSDGTFRPYTATTRAQLAKIVVGAEGWPLLTPPTAHFRDVPPGSLFYPFVETAVAHGLVSGYSDGTFQPSNPVTRGQLAKIIVAAQGWPLVTPAPGHFRDVQSGYVFYSAIETAFAHGLISGYSDGTFRPGNPTTRGQIAKIVYGALPIP